MRDYLYAEEEEYDSEGYNIYSRSQSIYDR
jgi:hypothetical protein